MKEFLEVLEEKLPSKRDYDSPPLHLWNPPLSGDIAIRIDANGTWFHENGEIKRDAMVRLFASILRREADGEYYLVTPQEKWRIEVERHPLMMSDIDAGASSKRGMLHVTLNTGKRIEVSETHPLYLDSTSMGVAAIQLPHGLTALCTRPAWYRLVDMAHMEEGQLVLRSGTFVLRLPAT
ncbi:MAG: DUF1285 domain-containing protein [Halioglobus sp.]|nr:DUF1285 domain-containing protein [Halioglobus sp.]